MVYLGGSMRDQMEKGNYPCMLQALLAKFAYWHVKEISAPPCMYTWGQFSVAPEPTV